MGSTCLVCSKDEYAIIKPMVTGLTNNSIRNLSSSKSYTAETRTMLLPPKGIKVTLLYVGMCWVDVWCEAEKNPVGNRGKTMSPSRRWYSAKSISTHRSKGSKVFMCNKAVNHLLAGTAFEGA